MTERLKGNDSPLLSEGRITKEALEKWRERIGQDLRVSWKYNELASQEAIRNFANGVGDPNLLWRDAEYASKTRYGCIVAPPSWLYSVSPPFVQQGLAGVHSFHAGNDWKFLKPVFINDRITPKVTFTGFDEKSSQFAGKLVMEKQLATYTNQRNEVVARVKTWIVRAERQAAREKKKEAAIKVPHPWMEDELKKVEDEVLREEVRGKEIRYWEDTEVGDELPAVVKGPLGLTDEIAFMAGTGPVLLHAHGLALRQYRAHPAWGFRDPDTSAMEPIAAVHWNVHAANSAGLPYPYDIGIQRTTWLIHLLTNWMSDEGWLKSCYCEYRRWVYFSDVVWLRGKVSKKYVDDNGEYCVDVETSAFNQRDENTMPGRATIILPSREASTWPVEKRVQR